MMSIWWIMIGFGAYHGLNPGMGWLFALALGLQQRNERAIWVSLLPISLGHAASIAMVAVLVLAAGNLISITSLRWFTAILLMTFGAYKLFNYYRHPRWVGLRVGLRDLFLWSFLMAAAHGAGLMVAPTLLEIVSASNSPPTILTAGSGLGLAVALHTLSMLMVSAGVAIVVFRKLGLAVLRRSWINFDLIWAVALLVVGSIALYFALTSASHVTVT
jgi:hypothetical protein